MLVLDVRHLSNPALNILAGAYDRFCQEELGPIAQLNLDHARRQIDDIISEVLGVPKVDPIRELLGREPGLTARDIVPRTVQTTFPSARTRTTMEPLYCSPIQLIKSRCRVAGPLRKQSRHEIGFPVVPILGPGNRESRHAFLLPRSLVWCSGGWLHGSGGSGCEIWARLRRGLCFSGNGWFGIREAEASHSLRVAIAVSHPFAKDAKGWGTLWPR